jgi:hypothetical protein
MMRRLFAAAALAAKHLPLLHMQRPRVQLYPDEDRGRWQSDYLVAAAAQDIILAC